MAKISTTIVMPSFTQGRFLGEAARSVLRQGGDDVELIVMDGGSADDSLSVLATLSREFAGRVRWYSEPDAGPADAINKSVAAASGDVIGWLNSDDVYARGAIGRASRYLRANPDDVMVYGRGKHIDGCGRVIDEYPTLPPDGGVEAFADGCFICQPTALFPPRRVRVAGRARCGDQGVVRLRFVAAAVQALPGAGRVHQQGPGLYPPA